MRSIRVVLGRESVNLDRLADVLFLFHEVHTRLAPSRETDGKGREEGVA
jgi:hypothetical protein